MEILKEFMELLEKIKGFIKKLSFLINPLIYRNKISR
jgi:hypothetical protein